MKALIDTNVILDLFLNRQPFVTEATAIWQANAIGKITAYVSAVTLTTVFYVARKAGDLHSARQVVKDILSSLQIGAVDSGVLQNAEALPISDFEDAVQIASAQAALLDCIITRNANDFKASPVPIYEPSAFLALIK